MSAIVSADKHAAILNAFSTALAWVSLIFKSLETERQSERVHPINEEHWKWSGSNPVTLPYILPTIKVAC